MKIQIQNISKAYGTTQVLTDFSLEIESGGVFGLIGPNGAGKTTLMKILATLELPTTGTILLDGVNIVRKPNYMKNIIGYLPQDVAVYPNLTAYEFLSYVASMKGFNIKSSNRQIDELLDILHLTSVKKRRLSTYSGGMKQRVGIACALLGDPQVIIVDEPSVGLDPEERIGLRTLFGQLAQDRIVLLSTHIIPDIETTATSLAVIQNGRLLFHGAQKNLVKQADGNLETAYLQLIHGGNSL